MSDFVQFAALGLGLGSVYALLAVGLVLIYRGSGTINLAHGHFAVLAAFLFVELRDNRGLSTAVTLVLVVLLTAAVGGLVQLCVMRPLRGASPISRVIATLGVLTVVNESLALAFGAEQQATEPLLPTETVQVAGVVLGRQSLYLAVIAVLVVAALVASSRTRFGLALTASAENPRAARALGWSPEVLAMATWIVGGALAGLAGSLVFSTTSGYFTLGGLSLLIVGALAAALFAQFRSYPMALLAGWLLAIVQSEAMQYTDITGVSDAIPFIAIVVMLVIRGRGLPVRGTTADRLPSVGNGRVRAVPALVATGLLVLLMQTTWKLDYDLLQAIVVSMSVGIVALSIVVLTGYAGQLSLAQMALAGVGAYAAGRLVDAQGWTFGPALVAGIVAAGLVGLLLGLPALRTRGVNLTVVTFGLGFAVYAVLFSSTELTGGTDQTQIPFQTLFGLEIDPVLHLHTYASVCVVAFALVALLIANLRRGRVGRRLLAVRVNERAAASIGVSVFAAKLYAFSLAAAIAGLGGVLLAFSYSTILYANLFGPFSSINVMTVAVVGGVGYALGPALGVPLVTGGVGTIIAAQLSESIDAYVPLAGGVILILLLIASQNGAAAAISAAIPARLRAWRLPLGGRPVHEVATPRQVEPIESHSLTVSGVVQRFGGVTALSEVSLFVEPGKVLGLLGPNGAGKTTLVDVVTGYASPAQGRVLLGKSDITSWSATKRARAGLGRTFQSLELFDDLSVRENLLAASDQRDALGYVTDLFWPGRGRLTTTAAAAVEELGLGDVLDKLPTELSYGQRRLVAIARAVSTRPSVLLLDEPGAGLDESETAELGHLIRRLAHEWGMGVLLIEHDVAMVLRTSDDVVVLDFGRTIFTGAPGRVSDDPTVRTAYLGLPATADV
ncbi:branched-chain amino acid ABC transporter permease/ATP-binding protein [Nocardioides sp. SOB44]|uniref:Branched-chain amino acid ABC transporter permease/ATP-binding protein n=1 Tax=Nocardioides cremeus TaxID=3058044 RepID=A0ABT8TN69_9ACTN|nr:branched-chain amino acid ABC transporter permease/ATP-binding protein [Nocardioides cremeus]MDO3395412.1 branched-chain amino acid ABC transporter permease/ATP-binding protein [Nocardioides cremeus]